MSDGNVNYFKKEFKGGIDERDDLGLADLGNIQRNVLNYFEENEEILKPILLLLEKAEQILSILNLSDNTIGKYNELKELTFDKLSLEFKPLSRQGSLNQKNQNIPQDNFWSFIFKEKKLNNKKNEIIEFLIELIEKFVFEFNGNNENYLKKFLNEKENYFNRQFEKILNTNNLKNISKNFDDLEFELKMEEIKIKEFLNKSDISYKKFLSNLSLKNSMQSKYSYEKDNEEYVIVSLENKIQEMKNFHEIEINEYKEKFTELRVKYNPELQNDLSHIKNELQETFSILDKIKEMIHPFYEKYYSKNSNWYQNEKLDKMEKNDFKYKEIEEINFLISLTNKFFNDNKYLIEMLSTLQNEKAELLDERDLPLVTNAIKRNNNLLQISEDYKIMESNSINFYNNFKELIEYINKNIDNI